MNTALSHDESIISHCEDFVFIKDAERLIRPSEIREIWKEGDEVVIERYEKFKIRFKSDRSVKHLLSSIEWTCKRNDLRNSD